MSEFSAVKEEILNLILHFGLLSDISFYTKISFKLSPTVISL